jgi:hypothetical protein
MNVLFLFSKTFSRFDLVVVQAILRNANFALDDRMRQELSRLRDFVADRDALGGDGGDGGDGGELGPDDPDYVPPRRHQVDQARDALIHSHQPYRIF